MKPYRMNPDLSLREVECLYRVARGMSNAEIGAELHLSPCTIKTHLDRIRTKLDARNRAHMIAQAYRRGLLARAVDE